METRGAGSPTAIVTAIGWFGLAAVAFAVLWGHPSLAWWVRIVGGLAGALAFLGYGVEALSQELTVRRWAISQVVFTTAGVVFLIAAVFGTQLLGLPRVVTGAGGGLYLLGAVLCAVAARDLF